MQKQQRHYYPQQHTQQSPRAYSPEYSSPLSSQSILQARFDRGSPRRQGMGCKENQPEATLPIFQDNNTQMIPHVTVGDSDTGGAYVLSDMSDEQLIKQLQLQINSDKQAAAFQSSSNMIFDSHSNQGIARDCSSNQPFQERTINRNLSPTKESINISQASSKVKLQEQKLQQRKQAQQMAQKFVSGKVQSHVWQKPFSPPKQPAQQTYQDKNSQQFHRRLSSKPEEPLRSNQFDQNRVQQKNANPPVTHRDRLVYDTANDENENPMPRPYLVQNFIRSEITDTYEQEQTQTATTGNRENSPAISQEDKYLNYVETDSSKKLEQYMAWSSASPAQLQQNQQQQNLQQQKHINQDNLMMVHPFQALNSTIQEQPTEEQLQASGTVTMINYNQNRQNRQGCSSSGFYVGQGLQKHQGSTESQNTKQSAANSNSQQKYNQEAVKAPQILTGKEIEPMVFKEENGGESESWEQIKMINQAMQSNFPTNYSPENKDDVSDSLKDFSVEQRQNGINMSTDLYNAAPLVDFGNFNKAGTNQVSMNHHSQTSLMNNKDSCTTSQNAKQQAMTYFIQANMFPETTKAETKFGQGCADSTLLQTDKSQGSPFKQLLIDQTAKGIPGQIQRKSMQHRSPAKQRTSIYKQCQAPPEELYKPILRSNERASGNKQRSQERQQQQQNVVKQMAQSVRGLPAKLDFVPYTGKLAENAKIRKNSTISTKPNFISPTTSQVVSTRSRCDSKVSVRRNLETQLNNSKNSLSPIRTASPINVANKSQLKTMLQKFGINKDFEQKKQEPWNRSSRATSGRQDRKASPSPVILSRTRNDNINLTKSQNTAPAKTDFATLALQTRQKQVQRRQTTLANISAKQAQISTSQRPVQTFKRSITPKGRSPTPRISTIISSHSRNTLISNNMNMQEHMTETFSMPQPQPQPRASLYQLRRITESMKTLDIQMFLELERIKKPSAAVSAISRMSCGFFEALRNRDQIIMDQVEGMTQWSQIQEYMRTQLTCCVPELRTLIKQKIISLGRLNEDTVPEAGILKSLEKIWQTFFNESKIRVIRRFIQTSKPMRTLVHLIYAFLCLALNLEREFNYENLMGLTEQPQIRFDEVKSIYGMALQLANQQNQPNQNQLQTQPMPTSQRARSSLLSNKSREHSLEIHNIEIDQNNQSSCCSKCSCHARQDNKAFATQASMTSKTSGKRSQQGRKSTERSKSPKDSGNVQVQMDMHVFRTLEQAYMEQLSSLNSQSIMRQQPQTNISAKYAYQQQQTEMPARKRSASGRKSQQEQQVLAVNKYTSVQLPKPYQVKPRTQTPDDLSHVMAIMDNYEAETCRNSVTVKPTSQITSPANCSSVKNKNLTPRPQLHKSSITPRSVFAKQPQQEQRHSNKESNGAMKRKRKSTTSAGSDFVSVVRASAVTTAQVTPKASRQKNGTTVSQQLQKSPKAEANFVNSKKENVSSGAVTSRPSQNNQLSQSHNISKYQAVPVRRTRKESTSLKRQQQHPQLLKVPSNGKMIMGNSASQNRLMTVANSNGQKGSTSVAHGKHSRTSTLFKSTASASAKQKTQLVTSRSNNLQRDASSKAFQKPQAANANHSNQVAVTQQASTKPLSRKTKSQTNLKSIHQTKRSATPKEQKNAFADMLKQQKRKMAQRQIGALRTVSQQDLDDFIAIENTLQLDNVPTIESLEQRQDTIPSFGGTSVMKTEIHHAPMRPPSPIAEEESSHRLKTKRTARAPALVASFTPEKVQQTFMEVPDSSANPKTPFLQAMETVDRYMQEQDLEHQVMITNDSLEEPACAIDCHMPQDQRTHFIMEKAQAITENINSCYKQHNMPKIDMATIQKLKMRRQQFIQQACADADQNDEQIPQMKKQSCSRNNHTKNAATMQSCNVVTTMTCETVVPDSEFGSPVNHQNHEQQVLEDISFTEALNKLKAEVACLMQQRGSKTAQNRGSKSSQIRQ